jgi:asparagine synthase (glutamine-hydrolysing)
VGERLPSDRHSPLLNLSRLAKGFLAAAGMPFEERYRAYVQVFPTREAQRLLRLDAGAYPDAITAAFRHADGGDALNRMLAVDAETQLPDDLLMLTDKMSMATSLECRVPLLDHELVELAASMPEEVKIRGGRLKHVLKEAVSGLLPRDILERKKRGFGTPMGAWLKQDLAPLVRGLLSESAVRRRELFHFPAVQELIGLHETNRVDGTDRLLALLNLEIWSRLYLDGRTADDVTGELKAMLA